MDFDKKMSHLIALKNMYIKNGDVKNADEVRREMKELKFSRVVTSSNISDSSQPKQRVVRTNIIPEIPDAVIINNIDITDMLHKLKNADNSTSANEIYNFIINLCEDRESYINSILKKNINSYELDTELRLSPKAKQAIESLESYIGLDEKDIENKISLILGSIDSYDLCKGNLKLKSNAKRKIKRIKSSENLSKEEADFKISIIINSVKSYNVSKFKLKLKQRVKKIINSLNNDKNLSNDEKNKKTLELLNLVDSYIIDKSCLKLKKSTKKLISDLKSRKDLNSLETNELILKLMNSVDSYNINKKGLALKQKAIQSIESLKSYMNLSSEDIRKKISVIICSVDSYDIDKKNLKLKSTLQEELSYIKYITSLAYRLLVDIKRKDIKIKVAEKEEQLTKKQDEILKGIYIGCIGECSIDDYYVAFKYFVDKEDIDKDKIIFIVTDFFGRFQDINNKSNIFEAFIKIVRRKINNFSSNDKRTINSLMKIKSIDNIEILEDDYRYEVLTYFLNRNDKTNIEQLISKMPDIANGYYNGKSIVLDMISEVLDNYNIILCNYKEKFDIVDIYEETFIKLYNINNKDKEKIELLITEYIKQLKTIDCSTVSKNIVLYRLNKIREKMGMIKKVDLPEISGENYMYLDYYYNQEISNIERRYIDDSVLINNKVSYSVMKSGNYVVLRINVVDLTPYFIEGTDLNELAINNCVDTSMMKNYIKFENGKKSPSITYEFHFHNGILSNSIIYDSIVSPVYDKNISNNYSGILSNIGISVTREDFNELIKNCLRENEGSIPYIVKYTYKDNEYYKIITDLNHIFSKLDKSCVDKMYEIFENNKQVYGFSKDIVGKMPYNINVLEPSCNYYDILMQRIIRSYYNSNIHLNINTVKQYIK